MRDNRVQLNPILGFQDGEKVKVSSAHGEYLFEVKCSESLREDTAVITSNTLGVNYLTPSIISEEGENACYQEVKVRVERV